MMGVLKIKDLKLVDKCMNGLQSVELIRKAIREGNPDRYSLVLTDMSMPKLDGFEASYQMR